MKLNDLIKSTNWLSVEQTLLRLYPDSVNEIDDYRDVFEKLKTMEPVDYNMSIALSDFESDKDIDGESETNTDVYGRETIKTSEESETYAIEFVEWNKWLGMDLAQETITNYTEYEIIAHCLHEMTLISFDESEIKEQLDSLSKTIEEFQNMNDEQKEKNTTTLDEFLKRFEDELDDEDDEDDD